MAATKSPLTHLEEETIITAARKVWNEVAYDMLTAMEEAGESSISRDEVFEVSIDAHRPLQHGVSRDLLNRIYDLPESEVKKLAKKAFPHARYS